MRNTIVTLLSLLFLFGCSTNHVVPTQAPSAPTNLSGLAISGSQINLSWTDNATNEVGYKVQRKTTVGNFTDVGSTGTDISTFSDLGLTSNTAYTYRVYAYNAAGNSLQYSNEINITTTNGGGGGGSSVTDIDGNIYPTVLICNQRWTAKNLDVSHYKNGDVIPQVTDPMQWSGLTTGAWCYYNNDAANGPIYGKLYNWYALNDARGLAPEGCHVPIETEWNKMVKCIDPAADTVCQGCVQSSTAGGLLKETGVSHWLTPNVGATNITGFSGLPGGYCDNNGLFNNIGQKGYWWSSKEYSATYGWYRYMASFGADINRYDYFKTYGFSIRLIKD